MTFAPTLWHRHTSPSVWLVGGIA